MDNQNVGCWDSVLLENESENCFISNLQQRFKRDLIYVRLYYTFLWFFFSYRYRRMGKVDREKITTKAIISCSEIYVYIYFVCQFLINIQLFLFHYFCVSVLAQTYVGSHLISLNPFCKPPTIFSPDLINSYAEKSLFQLPPHMWV